MQRGVGGAGSGRVMRGRWINFQCRGVLLIWIIVGQGTIARPVRSAGVVWAFLARLFSKKTWRYCHSLSSSAASTACKTLTFSNNSFITRDI